MLFYFFLNPNVLSYVWRVPVSIFTLQNAALSVVNYSNEKFSTDMVTNNRNFSKETFGKSDKIN
jgi:hypothetical protein